MGISSSQFNGILGQCYPNDTNNHELVKETQNNQYKTVQSIFICNSTNGIKTFRIFLGAQSSVNIAQALFYDVPIDSNTTILLSFDAGITIDGYKVLVIQASAADSLTFTAFGKRTDGNQCIS